MMRLLLLLLLLAGCGATDPPPDQGSPPSTPPRIEPGETRVVIISGHVLDATGLVVSEAAVRAWPAAGDCEPVGGGTPAAAEESSEYRASIEIDRDSYADDCIVVEASGGGAIGRAKIPATFTRSDGPAEIRLDVRLAAAPTLTRADTDRMIAQLTRAINTGDQIAITALAPFAPGDLARFRAALQDYRLLLGEAQRWSVLSEEWPQAAGDDAQVVYELRGTTGRRDEVTVYQDATRRLHSPILYYAAYSRALIARILLMADRGDASALAHALTVDDLDYPVEKASALMARYRARFDDLGKVEIRFVDHEEQRALLHYMLAGTKGGAQVEEEIALRYGDGLIGLFE